jgi:hypothetical protein
MRTTAAALLACLALPLMPVAPARAQTDPAPATLTMIAEMAPTEAYPENPEAAPGTIDLPADFAEALRATPLDGGREKRLFISFLSGAPVLEFAAGGARYTASGSCPQCAFPQPITGHTHPYENPFSVQDLKLVARWKEPSLMVTRSGQVWLALPTLATVALPQTPADDWRTTRYALFGNRLECSAREPSDGWASPTVMGRRVEAVARAAAAELGIALYVADPGQPLRRLAAMPADLDLLSLTRPFDASDLNTYEMSLLRVMHGVAYSGDGKGVRWPVPTEAYAPLDEAMSQARPERSPGTVGGMRNVGDIAAMGGAYWIEALPTTVYTQAFSDVTARELTFVSIQNSADCSRVLVMEGVQTFAPDGVRYGRGWARDRASTAPIEQGWTVMTEADFPTGQVVPW